MALNPNTGLRDFNSPDYWTKALADIQAGRIPGVTPKVDPSQIPSFESWMTPERQAYYANYQPGSAGNILRPDQRTAATAAGVNPSRDNSPQDDYLNEFYNLPSFAGKDPLNYLPILAAAAGGLAAGGAFGGAATGTAAAPTAALPAAGTTLEGATALAPEFGLGGGATGYGVSGTAAVPAAGAATAGGTVPGSVAAGSTPLSRLLGLGQTGSDILSVGGAVLPAVLGYFGADKVADANRDVQNQFLARSAPSLGRFEASFQPGFDLFQDPVYRQAAERSADIAARSYSSEFGNPAESPTAQAGIFNEVLAGLTLPALANYRGINLQGAGMGLNTAGTAALTEAGAAGGGLDAIGLGLGRAMTPQLTLDDLSKRFNISIGGARL